VYVSHGRNDGVLPIEATSRRIVPALRIVGYRVDYREFSGGHEVPTSVADAVLRRIL
jgi:predicted esterase